MGLVVGWFVDLGVVGYVVVVVGVGVGLCGD